jgi:membrane-bound lytic murein transglycosylase F
LKKAVGKKLLIPITVMAALSFVFFFLFRPSGQKEVKHDTFDLSSIKKRGKLIAITDFNSTDYFIEKNEPKGFNYEMLKSFSDHLGVGIEIVTENNIQNAIKILSSGKADLIAIGLPENSSGMNDIRLSSPVDETRQVLVKMKDRRAPIIKEKSERLRLMDQLGLGRSAIYIQTGYAIPDAYLPLASALGDSVNVLEVPYEQENLIKYVAEGLIDFAICDENIAVVHSQVYPVVDISTPASKKLKLSWAVRKNDSDSLLTELNSWITDYKKSTEFAEVYSRYYGLHRQGMVVKKDYLAANTENNSRKSKSTKKEKHSASPGVISRFDDAIRKYTAGSKWDWRLIASIIYQESRFNPAVESISGAYGLMQIMPVTARKLGIDIKSSPESNIKAGVKYLNSLLAIFDRKVPDEKEKINFVLAAYNAGLGHVLDAMKLAEKNGKDPGKWEGNVETFLAKKSEPEYYQDPVVKFGYYKGIQSVNFVNQILSRYEHYKNVAPENLPEYKQSQDVAPATLSPGVMSPGLVAPDKVN